jgi:hypothetical protein
MAEFEVIKQRLLLRELDQVNVWEVHAQIIEQAELSGGIAAQTGFPVLLFPALFEERVRAILQAFHYQEANYWEAFRGIVNSCE